MGYYGLLWASGIINKNIVTHRNSSELIKFYSGDAEYTEYAEYAGAYTQSPHNTHTTHIPQKKAPKGVAFYNPLPEAHHATLKKFLYICITLMVCKPLVSKSKLLTYKILAL